MKVVVAGGAGFIGSHLCEALLGQGNKVTVLDNLITGKIGNIEHLFRRADFDFIEHDVSTPLPLLSPDAVFQLASPASPVGYGKHPIETMLVNSAGTYNLLELARKNGSSFLLASTSEAYGDPLEHPQRESYWGNVNPVGPRACYDESKRYAEAMTINYVWLHDLNARIIRIFNTYGPRNDPEDGRVVPNFICQALRHEQMTVYGEGSQTRSFCYVSDLVRGILRAMFCDGSKGEVINLGNPDEHSILDFAQTIKRLANSNSPILHTPPRQEEITRRKPDITKAKLLLGWQPEVSLEKGLEETIDWFRSRLSVQSV